MFLAIGGLVFFNYIKKQGHTVQDYFPQIAIAGLLVYMLGSKKAEVETDIDEKEAVKLAEGLVEDKIKSGKLPAGTRYKGGIYVGDKVNDGQIKHWVVSGILYLPEGEKINVGIKVNFKRPGSPRMYESDTELKGDEQPATVFLPGRLARERDRFPWMFGKGGG